MFSRDQDTLLDKRSFRTIRAIIRNIFYAIVADGRSIKAQAAIMDLPWRRDNCYNSVSGSRFVYHVRTKRDEDEEMKKQKKH